MPINIFKKKKTEEEKVEKPTNIPANTTEVNQQEGIPQTTAPDGYKNPDPGITIVDIEEKKREIKKKRKRFRKLLSLTIISAFILIFGPLGTVLYKRYFVKPEPIIQNPEENISEQEIDIVDPESLVEYKNDELKISLDHLQKATLFENVENTELTKRIEIVYDKSNDNNNTTLDNLSEGYIFRISSFSTSFRKIDEIAQVKKEAFILMCPDSASFSPTVGIDIDGIEGRTFDVTNCGADYKVSYILKNGLNYEFAQIFKGDLGYRQLYKAETENILRSTEFYPEKEPELGPIETYNSEQYNISFEYPRSLDSECCKITGPISFNSTILLTLGNPETFVDDNNLDAIAFFVDQNTVGNFDEYVEKQKSLLTDDYLVAMGQSPEPQIRSVKVGNRDAVMLRRYSWRGNDLIYVDITPTGKRNQVLVISIKNITGDDFEDVTDSILESFKFY